MCVAPSAHVTSGKSSSLGVVLEFAVLLDCVENFADGCDYFIRSFEFHVVATVDSDLSAID